LRHSLPCVVKPLCSPNAPSDCLQTNLVLSAMAMCDWGASWRQLGRWFGGKERRYQRITMAGDRLWPRTRKRERARCRQVCQRQWSGWRSRGDVDASNCRVVPGSWFLPRTRMRLVGGKKQRQRGLMIWRLSRGEGGRRGWSKAGLRPVHGCGGGLDKTGKTTGEREPGRGSRGLGAQIYLGPEWAFWTSPPAPAKRRRRA
jgi:hypothetical protein